MGPVLTRSLWHLPVRDGWDLGEEKRTGTGRLIKWDGRLSCLTDGDRSERGERKAERKNLSRRVWLVRRGSQRADRLMIKVDSVTFEIQLRAHKPDRGVIDAL